MHLRADVAPGLGRQPDAFLNVPYDETFTDLFLAYVSGLSAFGLNPCTALEISGGQARLTRILQLLRACRYSFHDLSCVTLDRRPPRAPRFNMPFELGLAVACAEWAEPRHTWFVFEAKRWRLQKSLSDLSGSDPYIHGGSPDGVFRQLGNALTHAVRQPSVGDMNSVYRSLRRALPPVLATAGARSVFEARVFRELVLTAWKAAAQI